MTDRRPVVGAGRNRRGTCDACGHRGAAKSYRLNPRNWHEHIRLLCTECRRRLRYTLQGEGGHPR